MMASILSTKLLTAPQQELVLNTGLGLTHFDILKIQTCSTLLEETGSHVIITSKNAIPALLQNISAVALVSCVGEVTASLLRKENISPTIVASNAKNLASELIANYADDSFVYLCSPQRREELPALFLSEKTPLKELFVYRSVAVVKSFDRIFAAVLFYSPSGVEAFAKANSANIQTTAICIGETTASMARNYFKHIQVAKKQTVENTLITAIKALRND